MVTVTSAGFTRQAKELANKTGVLLYTFDDVLHEFVSEDKQVQFSAQQGHSTMSTRSTSASLDTTVSGTNNQSNLQLEEEKPEIQNAPITSSVTQKENKDVTNTSNKNDTTRTKQNKTDIQWKDRSIGIKQGLALLIQPRIACNSYLTVCVQLDGTVAATEHRSSKAIQTLSKWTNILTVGAEGSKIIGLRSNGYVIDVDAESGGKHCNSSPVAGISKHGMSIGESEIAVADGNMFHAVLKKDGTVITKLKMDKYHYAYDAIIADYKAHTSDRIPDVSTWRNIVAIDAGWGHLVGLKADGTVVASGENDCGQCNVSHWSNIIAIATGNSHTVGVTAQGDVLAVGSNRGGQCNVAEWVEIVSIVAMGNNTLGIKADGTVVGTGEDVGYGCRYNWRLFNNIDTIIEELKSSLEQI